MTKVEELRMKLADIRKRREKEEEMAFLKVQLKSESKRLAAARKVNRHWIWDGLDDTFKFLGTSVSSGGKGLVNLARRVDFKGLAAEPERKGSHNSKRKGKAKENELDLTSNLLGPNL